MKKLLLGLGLLVTVAAHAQPGAPTSYEFMTVIEIEYQSPSARLLFVPAFEGKTELPLEEIPTAMAASKILPVYRHNVEVVNRQLEAVTAAGWELVLCSTPAVTLMGHEYLFRRPKK